MDYTKMTRTQLINELETLSKQVTELQKVKTERNLAGQALRESEQKYRTLVESIPMKVFHKDRNSIYVSCNDLYAKDLRIPVVEIAGRTDYDFYPKSLAEKYRADDQRIMESGKTEQIEEDYIESGEQRTVLTVKTPVRDERGNVTGVLGIFTDITARKKGEERLRVAAESLSDVIYEWDMKNRLDWFGKIDELLGYAPNEFPRTLGAWVEHLHPEDQDTVMAAIDSHLKTGAPYDIEYRVKRKDGTWRYWLARGRALRDAQSVPYKWIGAISDITERKKIEKALWESEERYRALIENTLLGITVIDTDYKIVTVNPVVAKTYNRPISDFVGKYCFREFEKREAVCPHCPGTRAMVSGKTEEAETQAVIEGGNRIYLRNRAIPFFGPDGVMKGFIEVIENIDERKKAEEEVRRVRDQMDSILASVQDVIWSATADGQKTLFMSKAAESVYGRPPEDSLKNANLWFEMVHPDDKPLMEKAISDLYKFGHTEGEYRIVRTDGSIAWVSDRTHLVYDKSGAPLRIDGIVTDITQRKQAEKEKEELRAQLMQSAKMAAVGQLAGGIAHEINNPLTVILGFAEGLAKRLAPGDTLEMPIKSIEREAVRCGKLVQDLLVFSRSQKAGPEELDVVKTIESAMSLISARAKNSNIKLVRAFGENIPHIFANSNQLQQVIINLANNAFDAMGERGTLTIRARGLEENGKRWVEIRVEDTGTGIPEEIRSRIFEPFFTTKEAGKGTGLGLGLCYEIVKNTGGTITFTTEAGKGTCFTVRLPAADGGANAK
jgi:PAS domain S-box-containing protein